jgi:hypothetical protein
LPSLRIFVALFCGGVFFVLTRAIFKVSIEVSETAAYQRVAKGLRNPRRIRDAVRGQCQRVVSAMARARIATGPDQSLTQRLSGV